MAEGSWKEELALIAIIIAIGVSSLLTYFQKISGDNFVTIILNTLIILAAVLGVREALRRNSGGG